MSILELGNIFMDGLKHLMLTRHSFLLLQAMTKNDSGVNYLNVFSDYQNQDHPNKVIESFMKQEFIPSPLMILERF